MTYSLNYTYYHGTSGVSNLRYRFYDSLMSPVSVEYSLSEIGSGHYGFSASIPDSLRGYGYIYYSGSPTSITSTFAVNPEEGEYINQSVSSITSSISGAGAISNTVTVNIGGNPIAGVKVWITTDQAGTNVVAGSLTTDVNGQVTFYLDEGTYWVHMYKPEYQWSATQLTVTA